MCGISGFWAPSSATFDRHAALEAMTCSIATRGPDDSGTWADVDAGLSLGHRRLSILDLSEAGHQPMRSRSGRWVVVFNGELYNFADVREQLGGDSYGWRGHSDTEVLLGAVERWGVRGAVTRFAGMFAMALWDRERRELHLVRDRLGEKPLYVGRVDGVLMFGSELKALRAHPRWTGAVDRDALTLFFRHGYVPAPRSIYRGVWKVRPGTILTFGADASADAGREEIYWSARAVAEAGAAEPLTGTDQELLDGLEAVLARTIREEMVADVPLGAFLSGGIDSSLVVALMQRASPRPVRTFTIGFDEAAYDESAHAEAVARHLGTEHTALVVTPAEAQALVPKLPAIYDEPFADSSQIPTCLVAAMARRHVTVSLSGDGGDELFGGYNRYTWVERLWRWAGALPPSARRGVASAIRSVSPTGWDRAYGGVARALPRRARVRLPGDKLHKLAGVLAQPSPQLVYYGLISQWHEPARLVLGGAEPPTTLTDSAALPQLPDLLSRMMYLDAVTYLPDDILVKVDRASMAVSLETRAPFLDHRVVEFASRLPRRARVRDGQGKWLLRHLLYRHVPASLVERPKMGFGVPVEAWIRGPLRPWAEELLSERRLREGGYLDVSLVRQRWAQHLSGRRNWQAQLWSVLMFQAWLEVQS